MANNTYFSLVFFSSPLPKENRSSHWEKASFWIATASPISTHVEEASGVHEKSIV
jgi:hypothetical protein